MRIRLNLTCITGLIVMSVLAFNGRLSAALITEPANDASFRNTDGSTDVTVKVTIPGGTGSMQYYINDYKVSKAGDKDNSFTFKFLQGGSYTVDVEALAANGSLIERDSVDFAVDYRPLDGQYNVRRINGGKPIIDKQLFKDAGATRDDENGEGLKEYDNMNGPTVIRIPSWITKEKRAHLSAKYYCYFSHHQGQAIYMAWAAEIEGPWHLWNVEADVPNDEKGVLAMDNGGETDRAFQLKDIGNGLTIRVHMASPEILIDDEKEKITMFFHGPYYIDGEKGPEQSTFAASSSDGLSFKDEDIGNCVHASSYLSVFRYKGELYGMDSSGTMYRHPDPDNNLLQPAAGSGFDYSQFYWEKNTEKAVQWQGDGELEGARNEDGANIYLRHVKTFLDGDTLFVAYSATRGVPERLFYITIDLSVGDWTQWRQSPDFENPEVFGLGRAEAGWEGGHFPVVASEPSAMDEGVNQLRDPQFFRDDDGQMYMFYAGQGEDAIGMARLLWGTEEPGDDNNSPQIESAATATRSTIIVGETTELSVVARDPDGDALTYTWRKLSGSGSGTVAFSVNGTGTSNVTDASFSAAGTYELEVLVSDGKGGTITSSVEVLVNGGGGGENRLPTITQLTASTTTLTLPANTIELKAIASDLDEGDSLTYTWSGAGVIFAPATGSTTIATLPSAAGTYNIQLELTDDNGGTATSSVNIVISDASIDGGDGGGAGENSGDDGCGCSAAPGSNGTPLLVVILLGLVFYRNRLSLKHS